MEAVRARPGGNGLKGLITALCVVALALGHWTSVAAQNYPRGSSASEVTPDSGASSTLEMPTETTPIVGATGNPSAQPTAAPSIADTPCVTCDENPETFGGEAAIPTDMAGYEAQDFDLDPDEVATSWIGLSLARDRRKLKSGGYASGLLIVEVQANSPAARAGLQPPLEGKARTAAEVVAVAAGMVFPPVLFGAAIIHSTHLDESYDMIIGVDGDRITDIADFENHMGAVHPGEVVYLNLVRNGLRLQVPVFIPADMDAQRQQALTRY
jgi:S1-C subfamily serine protease